MHQLYILKKKPAVSTAFLGLANLEVAEFKAKIESGTYFSENEDSENDDAFANRHDEINAADILELGFEHTEDELDEAGAKGVLPGNATEGEPSVQKADIPSSRVGDAIGETAAKGTEMSGSGGGSLSENSEAIHPDGTSDPSTSPTRSSKKQKVRLFTAFLVILMKVNTTLTNFCVLP
jgi:hypothetical protein